jgi:hypothetical protein
MWHEGTAGRTANDITSAIIKILVAFLSDNPRIEHVYVWSDSCVGQNRNSIMATCLVNFLRQPESWKLKSITQMYCVLGHSYITEVDLGHRAK